MSPLISIIIPIYNSSSYLKKCINSILMQSFKNFEIIAIDDGSLDNSFRILEEFSNTNPCLRIFKNSNHGVSYTRNYGISKARGEYICFIDSDDWIESNFLNAFAQAINNNPNVDYIIQGILYDWNNNHTEFLFQYPDIYINNHSALTEAIPQYHLFHNGCPVAKLFKKEIILKYNISFNEMLSMHEDHIFVLDYFTKVQSLTLLSNIQYHYMRMNNSNSLSHKIHTPESLFTASNLFLDKFKSLEKIFPYENTEYKKDLYTHYGLSQKLRGILNLYKLGYDSYQCKTIIQEEKYKNKDLYLKWYKCTTFSRRIYLYFFLYTPFNIFNMFNKLITSIK